MVLRGKPVGEQGAADRWTALSRRCGAGPSGAPLLFSFPFSYSGFPAFWRVVSLATRCWFVASNALGQNALTI